MKTFLSIIRWKFVIPVAIVLGSLVVFFIFFFDPIASRVLEKVGSRVIEAKVDVSGFHTQFLKGRVSIGRLQVTNKDEPMQNALDAGPLVFQMDLSELFSKRVIINEATLSGLQFNTPRKLSGALPKRAVKKEQDPPGAAAQLAEKYKERFALNLDGMKSDVKSKIEFDPETLELVKLANDLKESAADFPALWDKSIAELDAENRLKKIGDDLNSIKSTPTSGTEALTAIPASLKKLKESKEALDQLKKDVQETKQTASTQLQEIKNLPKALAQAKKKDMDDLMSRLNLDFAQPDRLVEGLLGKTLLSRIQQAMHYVALARKHMPSQKEAASVPEKPRLKGLDVEFPTPAALPRFWLMKATLDGIFEEVKAAGTLSHLTTNPTRVGKPFQLKMEGQKDNQVFSVQGVFDHVGDNNKDSLAFAANGLDMAKWTGDSAKYFSGGGANVALVLALLDQKNLGGDIKLSIQKLKFNDAQLLQDAGIVNTAELAGNDALKSRFILDVARAIEKVPAVEVGAQIYGTWTDPNLKVTSNLAGILSDVIKKSVGTMVQDQRKQLEAKLDQLIKEKSAEVQAKLGPLEEKLNGQFGGVEKKVQDKINEATGINLGSGDAGSSPIPGIKLPDLKKFFKK